MQKTLNEIAQLLNGAIIGDSAVIISGVSKIDEGKPGTISFLSNQKYRKHLLDTKASAVIVGSDIRNANVPLLQVDDPYYAFREVLLLFYPPPVIENHIIQCSVVIEEGVTIEKPVLIEAFVSVKKGARIGKHSSIGAHTFIGTDVFIGEQVTIHPHVTILNNCVIGNRVIIHSGAVIGSDGFGYAKKRDIYLKIPQIGNVVIDDDAEIGANCTIDRAALGSTYIGVGCKIDNLVHVAHNVTIGEHTAIAAQTGISGSTKIGPRVTIAGQVGIVGHIEIGENVILGAKSGIKNSVPKNSFYFGFPARNHIETKRIEVMLKKLPEMYSRLKKLESKK